MAANRFELVLDAVYDLHPGEIIRRNNKPHHYIGSVFDGDEEICLFWVWNKWGKYRMYKAIEKNFITD